MGRILIAAAALAFLGGCGASAERSAMDAEVRPAIEACLEEPNGCLGSFVANASDGRLRRIVAAGGYDDCETEDVARLQSLRAIGAGFTQYSRFVPRGTPEWEQVLVEYFGACYGRFG